MAEIPANARAIRHIGCGEIIYYYIGDSKTLLFQVGRAEDLLYADGEQVKSSDKMIEYCPKCKERLDLNRIHMDGDITRAEHYHWKVENESR